MLHTPATSANKHTTDCYEHQAYVSSAPRAFASTLQPQTSSAPRVAGPTTTKSQISIGRSSSLTTTHTMKQAATSSQCAVGGPARHTRLCVEARHPSKHHHRGVHPHSKRSTNKKRDISTSFRRGPVPRPLTNHTGSTQQQHDEEEQPMIMLGMPPPAAPGSFAVGASPTAAATASLAGLGNNNTDLFYTTTRPAATEPVVAAAAAAAAFTMPAQDLGLSLDSAGVSSDDELGVWAADADPLAAFDRVLDSLLVSPALPPSFGGNTKPASSRKRSSSSSSPSSSLNLSSLLDELPVVAVAASSSTQEQQSASGSSSSKSKSKSGSTSSSKAGRSYVQSLAAAAAAPAVTVIHCENEYERELEAAAALQQLLVVKVESSHQLLHGAYDSTLRFQTHTGLPTQLNAYLPHNDISQGFGYVNGSSHGGSGLGATNGSGGSSTSSSGSNNTADVLASMGVTLGAPAFSGSSSNSSGSHMGSAAAGSSLFAGSANSSSSGEPFSPVHAWYKQLAAQYAHSAAAAGRSSSPFRFLSLRGDAARARAVCRRLGVSAPLAVVLVDPAAGGRRLQEVVGAKIEQELPNGLLYFGGSDPSGVRPADQLVQINTEAELEAVKYAAPVSVVAFHVHAAPPCVRSYGRMHAVAQQQQHGAVSFGVMDVDGAAEGGAVSTQLNLQQLPTYIIYSNGQEVARLSSSPDRRRLGEVLAQQLSAAAAGQQQ